MAHDVDGPGAVPPERLKENVRRVLGRVEAALARAGRAPGSVRVVAVTKNRPASMVDALHALGVGHVGENRVQEALSKAESVSAPVTWHMIGHLQKNKARKALARFSSLHSADSTSLLARLDRILESPEGDAPVPFPAYVQVNVSGEGTKSGVAPADLDAFLRECAGLTRIRIEGLMTMPPWSEDPETARPVFRELASLARGAAERGLLPPAPGLSMGMTNDFEVAVEEGATVVRVGSAFFS
jgi:pyridoxal phosphate enzyme (YggS family)